MQKKEMLTPKEQLELKELKLDMLRDILKVEGNQYLTIKALTVELKNKLKGIPTEFDDPKYSNKLRMILEKLFMSKQEISVSEGRMSEYMKDIHYVKKNGAWIKNREDLKKKENFDILKETLRKYTNTKFKVAEDICVYVIELTKKESSLMIEDGITNFLGDLLFGLIHTKNSTLVYTTKAGYDKLDNLFKAISKASNPPIKVGK